MSKRALVILADGFEEIEAVTVIDVLRRGGVKVTVASLDFKLVTGMNDIMLKSDCLIDHLPEVEFDMIILPGGEVGTTHLDNDSNVQRIIRRYHAEGKIIGAISQSPRILDKADLLNGKKATSFPNTKSDMKQCMYSTDTVVVDGNIITSQGPGAAMHFAYECLRQLGENDKAQVLEKEMTSST